MRGGRGDPDFDIDEDFSSSDDEPAPKPSRARKQAAAKPKRAPKRPAGLVNLRSLIDEGLLIPADDVLTVEYKGTITHAGLTSDGRIRWKDMFFESPSAFSIYLKRLVNPTRKADDGWKTVKYAGKFLEQYKMELLMRRYGGEDSTGPTTGSAMDRGSAGSSLPPSKRARTTPTNSAAAAASAPAAAPALRQLAPRGRGGGVAAGSSRPPTSFVSIPLAGGKAAAAAAAAAVGLNGSSSSGLGLNGKSDNTPRPMDLGSMVPADHDFAPREGELAGMSEADELAAEPGPKHFISGVELEAMTNGTITPSSSVADTAYTPPGLAAAAAAAAADQQQDPAASGTATPSAAAGRPRRVIRAPERLINSAMGVVDRDDHDMVRCESYSSAAGSGAPGAQPFRIQVTPLAEVMMDFHAHLDRHEVIGLLAGSWDPANRLMRVERAFPVREAMANGAANDGINVEMDPEDNFKVTEVIRELYSLQVVGWYHSHPSFPALPSVIDIDNQLTMQQQYRQPGSSDEPYIAAIVSPYNKRLPGYQSSMTWFRVEGGGKQGANALEQGYMPMELSIERLLRRSTPEGLIKLIPALKTVALRYINKRSAANLAVQWQAPTAATSAAAADGEPAGTRLAKLLGSVRSWWPNNSSNAIFSADSCKRFMDLLKLMLVETGMGVGLAVEQQQQQQLLQRAQQQRSSGAVPEYLTNPVATTSLARALLAGPKSGAAAAAGRGPIQKVRIRGRTPPTAAAAAKAADTAAAVRQKSPSPPLQQQQVQEQPPQQQHQQRELSPQLPEVVQPQQQQQLQQVQQQLEYEQQQQQLPAPLSAAAADGAVPAAAEDEATDTETEDEADMAAAAVAAAASENPPQEPMQGLEGQGAETAGGALPGEQGEDDDAPTEEEEQ